MKKIIVLLIMIFLLISCVVCTLVYYSNETRDLEDQEKFSEIIAEKYLINVSQQNGIIEENGEQQTPSDGVEISDLEYDDNTTNSSVAHGYVDCVLEIPAIGLRQGIFSGTPSEIEHDLSKWLPVTSRSDYVLGATHYCVYVHNPRNKSIKISYAQETLVAGDYMVVTQNQMVYLYEITSIFPEWRNKCTDNFVNNMSLSPDKFYIFTCGRGEWQGRNLVIEGTVHSIYKLDDWNQHKDQYIKEYKEKFDNTQVIDKNEDQLIMNVEIQDDCAVVSLQSKDYTKINSCSIGICNSDGYLIDNIINPIEYAGDKIVLPKLPSGEYYVGVYDNGTTYQDPIPYKITIDRQTVIKEIIAVDQEDANNALKQDSIKIVSIGLLVISIVLGIVVIVFTIKNKQN